jgi:hypothetical protein
MRKRKLFLEFNELCPSLLERKRPVGLGGRTTARLGT